MPASEKERDIVARTLWGEARGEGFAGQVAVAWAIRNRVEMDLHNDGKPDWWGEGYAGVCLAKYQFSCWNRNDPNFSYLCGIKTIPAAQLAQARRAADDVIDGRMPDSTSGATHYYVASMSNPPGWAAKARRTVKLGRHVFYKDVP